MAPESPAKDRPLKVLFCPSQTRNPYLASLGEGLKGLGCRLLSVLPSTAFYVKSAEARRADVIHVHWPDPYTVARSWTKSLAKSVCFIAQLWVARRLGAKLVWTVHNAESHDAQHPRLQRGVQRAIARLSHNLIVHGHSCADVVASNFGLTSPSISVVPHANYIADYPNETTKAESRERLGLDASSLVFLFVGRVQAYKGLDELIAKFKSAGIQDSRLIIAGQPSNQEIDQEVAAAQRDDPRITYVNSFVSTEDMQSYMAAADVVVLPYRKIFTSGTLLLAASFGKPSIVPEAATLLDTVDASGLITFDPSDADGLESAMHEAARRREELPELGSKCLQSVRDWGWAEMSAATYRVYRGQAVETAPLPSR